MLLNDMPAAHAKYPFACQISRVNHLFGEYRFSVISDSMTKFFGIKRSRTP